MNLINLILGTKKVMLRDGGKNISDTEKVAGTLSTNKFFVNTEDTLKIGKNKQFLI